MSDVLLTDVANGVAVVTMHRPEVRNALNTELRRAIPARLRELDADPATRAMILKSRYSCDSDRARFDPSELAANREAIQARGRAQNR